MKLILATLSIVSFAKGAEVATDLSHVITLGTRPYYLLDEMPNSELKEKLGETFICRCSQLFTITSDCLIDIINNIISLLFDQRSVHAQRQTSLGPTSPSATEERVCYILSTLLNHTRPAPCKGQESPRLYCFVT